VVAFFHSEALLAEIWNSFSSELVPQFVLCMVLFHSNQPNKTGRSWGSNCAIPVPQ